jgi:hypothetical protein
MSNTDQAKQRGSPLYTTTLPSVKAWLLLRGDQRILLRTDLKAFLQDVVIELMTSYRMFPPVRPS